MLINIIIGSLGFNIKPITYLAIKNIKNQYYNNLLTYDIYKDETIVDTTLLTAEHIVPKSFLTNYNDAKRDMHNIFLTDAQTNIYRSNYPFSDKVEYQNLEFTNIHKFYHPCDFAKGQIARSIGYMKIIYPNIDINKVIDLEVMMEWNLLFEPSEVELKRNKLIYLLQGNINPLIEDPMNIYKFF
tara:strand:- start:673 stop:1227 length:555 start_codon:yes stop_codon:yes gene_type:complete